MSTLQRIQTCMRCTATFAERANIGIARCRVHVDPVTNADGCFRCCGHEPGALTEHVLATQDDAVGCLPCDHSSVGATLDTMPRIAVVPLMAIETGAIAPPLAEYIVAEINSVALRGPRSRILRVPMPRPLDAVDIDVFDLSYSVLRDFVQSEFYDMTIFAGVADARRRFEELVPRQKLMRSWNTDIDSGLHTDEFTLIGSGSTQSMRRRLEIVDTMRSGPTADDDIATAVPPYYIVRRVALFQDPRTLENIARYNAYRSPWRNADRR